MKHLQALAMIVFGACVAPPTDPPSSDDSAGIPDGTEGAMRVRFASGSVEEVHYVAEGGHAIWDGDIDLGPITRDRANAIVGLDHRWPKGVIHWKFGDTFNSTAQTTIRNAMAEWSARTPVKFIEGVDPNLPYLTVYRSTSGINHTSGVGPDSLDAGDETDVNYLDGVNKHDALHELGHVLGLTHEQERPDRNTVVSYDASCAAHPEQYEIHDDGYEELTPYDINSVMEYGSGSLCANASPAVSTLQQGTNCKCYPLVLAGHSHDSESGAFKQSADLSRFDVQAITAMYEPKFGSVEEGDLFGASMVAGDFDGDGFQDLAVGSPGEAVGATAHTGAVFLYRGTTNGLVAWKTIGALDITRLAAGGDELGFALAAGDFDGDGIDDLVIGAPGARNAITTARGGAAWVVYGSQTGPDINNAFELYQTILTTGVSESGDRFGSSFAVGDLDMDGHPDLAVGVIHEQIDHEQAGYVNTFTSHGRTFQGFHGIAPQGPNFGPSEFGNSLAIADFDDDGHNDLAIGSVGGGGTGPAVYIYRGTGTGSATTGFSYLASGFPLQTDAGNTFGTALAVGNFDGRVFAASGHKKPEIVVSAPNENESDGNADDSGRLYLFDPQNLTSGFALVRLQVIAQGPVANDTNVFGDELGLSLGVVHHGGSTPDDLVAGVHNKNGGKGSVVTFVGTHNNFLAGGFVLGWPPATITDGEIQLPQFGDELGTSLAVGDFNHDGKPDLIAGMPKRNSSGGAMIEYLGTSSLLFPVRYFDEASGSPQ